MLKHLQAILALPFTVTVIIPAILLWLNPRQPQWHLQSAMNILFSFVGILCLVSGLFLVISTIRLFSRIGRGTLAPWHPTQRLVIVGIYRYVRNPMILGVMLVLFGEAIVTHSPAVFIWFGLFTVANMLYMPLFEEPNLIKRFGDDYQLYRDNVPRWLPRRYPYEGLSEADNPVV